LGSVTFPKVVTAQGPIRQQGKSFGSRGPVLNIADLMPFDIVELLLDPGGFLSMRPIGDLLIVQSAHDQTMRHVAVSLATPRAKEGFLPRLRAGLLRR